MVDRRGSRFAFEVLFLVALAVGLTLAQVRALVIVGVMALGWVIVAPLEWAAGRSQPHFGSGLPPRYYVPRNHVRADLLVATDHVTTCPFKGDASYWSLDLETGRHENIVWSYADPIPEMREIEGLLCFYNERVDLHVRDELS